MTNIQWYQNEKKQDDVEGYYQRLAKQFVDKLFANGIFNPNMSRDDMQSVEDLCAYSLQACVYAALRAERAVNTIRNRRNERENKG